MLKLVSNYCPLPAVLLICLLSKHPPLSTWDPSKMTQVQNCAKFWGDFMSIFPASDPVPYIAIAMVN